MSSDTCAVAPPRDRPAARSLYRTRVLLLYSMPGMVFDAVFAATGERFRIAPVADEYHRLVAIEAPSAPWDDFCIRQVGDTGSPPGGQGGQGREADHSRLMVERRRGLWVIITHRPSGAALRITTLKRRQFLFLGPLAYRISKVANHEVLP